MSVERDFAVFLESMGGEDLLRWLMKTDGIDDWQRVPLYPIVAYSPEHLPKPIVIGVASHAYGWCNIMAQEWDFEHLPSFQDYVDYLVEMGDYNTPVSALQDHNKAMILNEVDMIDAQERGIETVMMEVINGQRPNGFANTEEWEHGEDFNTEGIEMLFSFIADILNDAFNPIVEAQDDDFNNDWQNSWA